MQDYLTVTLDLDKAEEYINSADFVEALRKSTDDIALMGFVIQSAHENLRKLKKETENNGNS